MNPQGDFGRPFLLCGIFVAMRLCWREKRRLPIPQMVIPILVSINHFHIYAGYLSIYRFDQFLHGSYIHPTIPIR